MPPSPNKRKRFQGVAIGIRPSIVRPVMVTTPTGERARFYLVYRADPRQLELVLRASLTQAVVDDYIEMGHWAMEPASIMPWAQLDAHVRSLG